MRNRTALAWAVAAALALATSPAHAFEEIPFGDPTVDFRYNDGETGVIEIAFGVDTGSRRSNKTDRPMSSACNFVVEPQVNSSKTNIVVEAHANSAPFLDGTEFVRPVGTGVRCVVKNRNGVTVATVEAAGESAVGTAWGRFVDVAWDSPITVCSTPSAFWSDNKFQIAATPFCKTS